MNASSDLTSKRHGASRCWPCSDPNVQCVCAPSRRLLPSYQPDTGGMKRAMALHKCGRRRTVRDPRTGNHTISLIAI